MTVTDRRFWALLLLPLLLVGLVFTGATVLASGATYINDRPGLTIPGGGWLGGHDPAPMLRDGRPILDATFALAGYWADHPYLAYPPDAQLLAAERAMNRQLAQIRHSIVVGCRNGKPMLFADGHGGQRPDPIVQAYICHAARTEHWK